MKKFTTHLQNTLFILYLSCNIIFASESQYNLKILEKACEEKNIKPFQKIIQEGKVNDLIENKYPPLYIVAKNGYTDATKVFLEDKRTNVNQELFSIFGEYSSTSLHIATENGHTEVVKAFLQDERTDVNIRTVGSEGETPLHIGAKRGHIEVVKAFLQDARTDVHKLNANGNTVFYVAAKWGHAEVIEELFKHNIEKSEVENAFYIAAQSGCIEGVEVLLKHNIEKSKIEEAFYIATLLGHTKVVQALLKYNIEESKIEKALCMATRMGCIEVVKVLLKYNIEKSKIEEAICVAAESGRIEIAEALLLFCKEKNKLEELNVGDALSKAVEGKKDMLVKIFLSEDKIKINKAKIGEALCNAAANGSTKIVSKLLSYIYKREDKIKINEAKIGEALCNAAANGYLEIVQKFLEIDGIQLKDIDINKHINGELPLCKAVCDENIKVIKKLVKAGADINKVNKNGKTALDIATNKEDTKILKILLRTKIDSMIFISPNSNIPAILSIITFLCCIYYFGFLHTTLIYSIYLLVSSILILIVSCPTLIFIVGSYLYILFCIYYSGLYSLPLVSSLFTLIAFPKGLILMYIGGIYLSLFLFPTMLLYLAYIIIMQDQAIEANTSLSNDYSFAGISWEGDEDDYEDVAW